MKKETNTKNKIIDRTTKKQNIFSEHETAYKKGYLKKFDSFEEMNEADAKEMAALSPQEHLQNVYLLTTKIFAEELKKTMDKKIKFK
jgi:hypothetical protein